MKNLITATWTLAIALAIGASTLAQSPANATRQRRTTANGVQEGTPVEKPVAEAIATGDSADNNGDKNPANKADKKSDKSTAPAEVTADAQTNRADEASEEAAIVPYYNNFFTTYRLGPEDVISVTVFGQDRYSRSGIVIPPSGRVSLTLIPDGIFVNGKTVDQVAELIKKRYEEYIIDPQVSVSLDKSGSYRYSVIGDVGQPGIKPMTRRLSVSEAIAEAGGVLQTGNKSRIVVLRKQANGTFQQIAVNLSAVYKGQAPDSVYLVPGDQVVVPGNKLKKLQTIMGFTQVLSFARMFTGGW
jgi:polysaccharide export outer membrane protein